MNLWSDFHQHICISTLKADHLCNPSGMESHLYMKYFLHQKATELETIIHCDMIRRSKYGLRQACRLAENEAVFTSTHLLHCWKHSAAVIHGGEIYYEF